MINLSDTQIIDYGDEYYNLVLPKIMPKYRALNHNLKNKLSGDRMIDFISGSNETEFKIFLKDLLTEKIDFLKIKYPQLAIYMYTADFLESTVSEVKKILIGISPSDKHSRTLARETYISEVIFKGGNNSIWIKELNNKRLNKNLLLTSEEKLKKFLKIIKIYFGRLNIFLKNVIDYSHISGEIRKNVLLNFGIEVCPYCNRNYISKFKKNGEMKVTADLDHYYFKDLYQVFCLSLYNFVPSCQICNSRLKGVKIKGIKNPYIDQINYTNFRFEVKIRNDTKLESVFGSNCDDLDIKIIHDEEYKNHIEIFQLENLYNSHKNIAAEILLKKQAYNNSYSELMLNYFEELNFNEMKKNIFLYGVELDENNFHKRPLSKFIFDLVNNDN